MTIKEALAFGAGQLKKIDSAALDASVLLCEAIKKPKEFLYTHPEKKLTPAQEKKYKNYIARRAKHEPVAYITGKKEFYGFEFAVSPAVLIPRPDTETLIFAVLSTVGFPSPYSIIDVGTGSGAIAVTLKKLLPRTRVFASDISPRSLAIAKKNARRLVPPKAGLGAKIIFKKGNLLSPFKTLLSATRPPIVITANLPYLSRAEWQKTAPEVKKYEPYDALVGGKHGWEIYEKLFKEISQICHSRPLTVILDARRAYSGIQKISLDSRLRGNDTLLYIFIEIGHNQKSAIAKLAKKILVPKTIEFFKDLAGRWRVAKITLTKS